MAKKSQQNDLFDSSWIPVFLALVFVWPLGLIMLWNKVRQLSNQAKDRRSKPVSGIGIGLIALALVQIFRLGAVPFGAFALIGGGALLFAANSMKAKERSYKKYKAIIGKNNSMPIEDIAAAMPVSYQTAVTDLQAMIDAELFPQGAYLDMRTKHFVMSAGYAPEAPAATNINTAVKTEVHVDFGKPVTPRETVAQKTTSIPGESSMEKSFREKLIEIQKVNEAIKDEHVSDQIDRIENVTASIFQLIKEQPGKIDQIRTFMNYYLPTTLKLLKSYSQMERQTVPGENIKSSMKSIEKTLDQLVWGFEQQLDNLFEADALDIDSDIKVLERMMAKDGLSGDPYSFPKGAVSGSAARMMNETK